jgi:hypothetical protein
VNYLVSQSFSQRESWLVAGLFEAALLILSFSLGGNGGRLTKTILGGLLIWGLFLMGTVVSNSAQVRGDQKIQTAGAILLLDKEIQELETVAKMERDHIGALDPEKFPSKREALLRDHRETTQKALDQKRTQRAQSLGATTVNLSGETDLMKKLRWFILAINVFFAHSLALIWYRKPSES